MQHLSINHTTETNYKPYATSSERTISGTDRPPVPVKQAAILSQSQIQATALPMPPSSTAISTKVEQQAYSIYNDAKFIFHAIGPKFHSPDHQGFDPARAIELIKIMLKEFVTQNSDLSQEMHASISNMQKSLSNARTNYLTCIGFVKFPNAMAVKETALKLSQEVQSLADDPSCPSVLFMGGHYIIPKGGTLGGHTTSFEVTRQSNGKLSFSINNTGTKSDKYQEIHGDRIHQLVYADLVAADLDEDFWKNIIKTNYINPVSWQELMDAFYAYVDLKLATTKNNKFAGRSFKKQRAGVCAWKALSIWLHAKISPGNLKGQRNPAHELVYAKFKKFMFENMLTHFKPEDSFKATIVIKEEKTGLIYKTIKAPLDLFNNIFRRFVKISDDFCYNFKHEHATAILKAELEKKIQKLEHRLSNT